MLSQRTEMLLKTQIKIKENKALLKKCDGLTQEYLIEEATTKEMIRAIHSERNEYKDVMNGDALRQEFKEWIVMKDDELDILSMEYLDDF